MSESLARRFWPQGALGRRLALVTGGGRREDVSPAWLRVVGVAPDVQYGAFGEETAASRLQVYRPYAAVPARTLALLVRTQTTPRAQADPVRRVLREVDPGIASWDVRTMGELRAFTTWRQRFFAHLMGGFAAQALLLSCLGVYGLLAFSVSRRTREIGVRMALGARPLDVVALVLQRGAALGLAGTAIGLLLALGVGRALNGVLYGIGPFEPWPLAVLAGAMVGVVLAASALPARRAAAVDPITALRAE